VTQIVPEDYWVTSWGSSVADSISAGAGFGVWCPKRVCPRCGTKIGFIDCLVAWRFQGRVSVFQPKDGAQGSHAVVVLCDGPECIMRLGFCVEDDFVKMLRAMGESQFFRRPQRSAIPPKPEGTGEGRLAAW